MNNKDLATIREFIEATQPWLDKIKNLNDITGQNTCPMCGIIPEKIEQLLKALIALDEKTKKNFP